ncbi:hypothetical protein DXG03_001223 [Asterophora parasitica]|uniref:RNA-dependent RNA polymerase n=1 Tax=Asterophora parasitica TaxID=117018 RepID=A0A9P7G571_9AGAR|nr:hypothetical protein DXG03_001223 [Asterophora parasitica]
MMNASTQVEYEDFPELNEEYLAACDAIELQHTSPVKDSRHASPEHEFSTLAHSSFSSYRPAAPVTPQSTVRVLGARSPTSASWTPQTPSKSRKTEFGTPARQITAAFDTKLHLTFTIEDTDEEQQVEAQLVLTDTDTSSFDECFASSQTSMSSVGSGISFPSTSKFTVNVSPSKKRIGESRSPSGTSSPSKRRQLERDAKSTPVLPLDSDDVFSDSATSYTVKPAPALRNNGWDTDVRLHVDMPNEVDAPNEVNTPNERDTPNEVALENFLSGPLGVDLKACIIAHDAAVQALMDKAKLDWGVQYEIARGIARGYWTWPDVALKIAQLGTLGTKHAYKVRSVMVNEAVKTLDDAVWQELDREQAAIVEGLGRGLGLMGPWRDELNWYGGQVQQLARLDRSEDTYKIHLEPPKKLRSHRLARFLGSRRIIQLRIPDELVKKEINQIKGFLLQKFVLCGRVYVPLTAKEATIYLVETNEDYERLSAKWDGDNRRMPFQEIVNSQNALGLNVGQPIAKWSTRFSLACSTTTPVIEFEEKNIFFIHDKASSDWKGNPNNAPAEKTTTDGCGFINGAALKSIATTQGTIGRPTAVQGRVLGSKGLWILHPTDKSPFPKIWIRPSQTKTKYPRPFPRIHRIFDLVAVSRASETPISLSKQSIMNLSQNGVPDKVLTDLMVQGLEDLVKPLMEWEGPQAMEKLWNHVSKIGGVVGSRMQRLTAGLSRTMGQQRREWGHDDVGMDNEDADVALKEELDSSSYTGRNELSGTPLSLHELVVEVLQAGFHPTDLDLLRDKLRYVIKILIKTTIEKFLIPLKESIGAYVAPDPFGILKEGEVYYRSSQSLMDQETQTLFNTIIGDGLVGRYPIRVESDIQKVKFVDHPMLLPYSDVLIVSTEGSLSFANILSGGDYDGDDLFIIRERSLVEPFCTKELVPMPKNFLEDNFERHPQTVEQFAQHSSAMSSREAQEAFQDVLLLSLRETKYGLYSTFHDYSVWKKGYKHPDSIRLSYMFNTLLDSGKSGLRLKEGVFEKDQREFGGQISETHCGRSYIFHEILSAAIRAETNLLRAYDQQAHLLEGDRRREVKDKHLTAPLTSADNHAKRVSVSAPAHSHILLGELDRIRAVVDAARKAHQDESRRLARAANSSNFASPKKKQKRARTPRETDAMAEASRIFAQDVDDVLFFLNVQEIKASYAYQIDSKFAFHVAFRDLCLIKAQASDRGIAPVTRSFDEAKSIPAGYVKAITRIGDII